MKTKMSFRKEERDDKKEGEWVNNNQEGGTKNDYMNNEEGEQNLKRGRTR